MEPARMLELLDPARMRERLSALPALRAGEIEDVALASHWIKPGRYFNAHYRFTCGGRQGQRASAFLVGARTAARVVAEMGPHRPDVEPGACPHCNVVRVDGEILLQRFPLDYRLPTLGACLDPARVSAALGGGAPVVEVEDVGYRPGMRCQIRYLLGDGSASFGKVAVERAPGSALELQRRLLASAAQFRVPEPAAYLADLALSVAREAPGHSLHHLLRLDAVATEEMKRVARALAELHATPAREVDKRHEPRDEVALVRTWTDLGASLFPELARDLADAADEIDSTCPAPGRAAQRLVHRDFHDKQILLGDNLPLFLDLDTACLGDAEVDLGNFAAHMTLRDLQWRGHGRCAFLAEALLAAYPAAIEPARLAWYRRATLLRLSCVYAVRPGGRELAPALIAEARRP